MSSIVKYFGKNQIPLAIRGLRQMPNHSRVNILCSHLAGRNFSSGTSVFQGEILSVETNPNGVAIVRLNDKSSKVNTLSAKMTAEMSKVLNTIESNADIKSVVLISDKKDCFIAGADIEQLQACQTEQEIKTLSTNGQKYMERIESSKKPFVAAINGSCLGGGLEVALACHYRIATPSKKTNLGLPEVMLGLLPGAGGTQRLPKLVGLQNSLDMMTTGKNIKADRAMKMGLVNQVADIYALEQAAIVAAEQLANGTLKPKKKKKNVFNKLLEDTPMGRSLVFKKAGEMIREKTQGHYPAPELILESVEAGYKGKTGYEVESSNFAKLGMTSVAKACMSIFFGQTALKKNRYGKPEKPVNTIGILGAGLMGAGIAQVSAKSGMKVLLKDRDANSASRGENYIKSDLDQKVKRRRMTGYERDEMMSHVYPLSDENDIWKTHFSKADLVLEAVFEDMALKHKVIQDIEQYTSSNCVIATNTSALSVAEIASASKHPENVIGMHYFSPVPKMPLLEIIRHEKTSDAVTSAAIDVGIRQGKTCILVKDVPGFYVNRCLGPYIAETLSLVQDGISLEKLDSTLTKWGMPVGPITLADEVGIDVASHVNDTLSNALGVRMHGGNKQIFQDMIQANFLGKKSGSGFFIQPRTKKDKKVINPKAIKLISKYLKTKKLELTDDDIIHRLMCRFINEAVLCVQDEIIASPMEGDMGAVFGVGFPPFIGGPFRYVDQIGSKKFTNMMLRYVDQYGEQFTPCQLLKDMSKTNKKFHSK